MTVSVRWFPWVLLLATVVVLGCLSNGSSDGDLAMQDAVLDGTLDQSSLTDGVLDQSPLEDLELVAEDIPPSPTATTLWEAGPEAPDFPEWFDGHPWLKDVSTWSIRVENQEPLPEFRFLGDLGVGNGHVFSLIGYAYPFNTLHSMVGPYYEKDEGFFGDVWTEVSHGIDGNGLAWSRQWLGRARGTDVVITQFDNLVMDLWTVDLAPRRPDPADPLRTVLTRFVIVKNKSAKPQEDLVIHLRFARSQEAEGGSVLERREKRERWTSFQGREGDSVAGANSLSVPVGPLEPGDWRVLVANFTTTETGRMTTELAESVASADWEAILDTTKASWEALLGKSMTLESPDVRVNDYLEGMKVVVITQQAASGATCPMSEYTGTWLRDNAGPVRLFARLGLFDELRAMLDYIYLAASLSGGIQNRYDANLDLSDVPDVDWMAKPTMTGRGRAEEPSYIAINYYLYWMASGTTDFIADRLDFMQYALVGQEFEDDLLKFSGDETFRTAMAIAHNMPATESYEEGYYSANSSFLWSAAARMVASLSEVIENTEVSANLREQADRVQEKAEDTYLTDSGVFLPYVHVPDNTLAVAPFEDVSTKPIWCGMYGPFDPRATANLQGFIEFVGGEDGIAVSPLPASYSNFMGLPVTTGIYTGMNPGYYLSNLALTLNPLAENAFNALSFHATPTGTTPEYQILDHGEPLHFMYDTDGGIGDYTARYRPWEGAILAEAALAYLVGFQPDAPHGRAVLAPNLPNGWNMVSVRRIRVGDTRFDLAVLKQGSTLTLTLTHTEGPDVTIALEQALSSDNGLVVRLDGETVTPEITPLPWGNLRVQLPDFVLGAGQTRVIRLEMDE